MTAKTIGVLVSLMAGLVALADWPAIHDREIWHYEPEQPFCDRPSAAGFHGRETGLVRLTGANAVGDESVRAWKASAWRNEYVHGQFVVWSDRPVGQLRCEVRPFVAEDGTALADATVTTRFVRYTRASLMNWKNQIAVPRQLVGDCLDTADEVDLPANGFRPVWLTVKTSKSTKPGRYAARLVVRGAGGVATEFPLELTVLDRTLPDPQDWKFYLDLWQHPWAVARYHGVKPFSPEHLNLMRPLLEELAALGQRTITTTLSDLPWNHQNYDAYGTMIGHVRNADGTWRHDYAIFDRYVAFAKSCGIGPHIQCYSLVPWGNHVFFTDGKTGDRVKAVLKAGSPEFAAFWGPFLTDFERHLKAKGWASDTYLALDERKPEELAAAVGLVRRYAPSLHVQMAGNRKPSEFKGIQIEGYCQFVGKMPPDFLDEARARTAAGWTTTFYACCTPKRPNTFLTSPLFEGRWFGLFAARGLSGYARWAAFNWMRDPLTDATFTGDDGNWTPGDPFYIYPGPRLSSRWEMLRDGIENFEKIRVLRESGRMTDEMERALAGIDYAVIKDMDDARTEAAIDRVERLLD